MPAYRRNRVPGGCYFFTINLRDRHSNLLVTQIEALRAAIKAERARHPFHIDAWVILPDHMHCQWTLPEGDSDFSVRIQGIKTRFTRLAALKMTASTRPLRKRESGIWQRRFWEHTIRDDRDYAAHMDYIHFNPVKHGLTARPEHWPYSTFRRCVQTGAYPPDWDGSNSANLDAGERA